MAILIETLKAGDVLYDVHSERAGNTTMRTEGCWRVYVKDVGVDERGPWALLSWNGNPPRSKTRGSTKYKRWPKEWIKSSIAGARSCAICGARETAGHLDACDHPRAIAARKKKSKA